MISRAGLRLDSNRPDEACQLFVEAKRSIKYLPNKFKSNYKALSDSLTCETLHVADSAEPELSEISTGQAVE